MKKWLCILIPALGFSSGCAGKDDSTKRLKNPNSQAVTSRYRFFAPAQLQSPSSTKKPLLVMIHGCDQTAEDFEVGSGMNHYAEKEGFYVLYPDQKKGRNAANCWRWFDPQNRRPGSGELAEIKTMIDEVAKDHAIDLKNIFVAGISSGSATAAALLACYPEEIKGAALHSGPALNAADNEFAAMAAMKFGPSAWLDFWATHTCEPSKTQKRFVVIQGSRDSVVHPKHADKLFEQFVSKDGAPQSYSLQMTDLGTKDLTVNGRRTDQTEGYLIEVKDLKHAWAGGLKQKYFEPSAFSASEMISRYLVKGENVFERVD